MTSAMVYFVLTLGLYSASAEEETAVFHLSNKPAAPTENIEARMAMRQHREATVLNRFTFPGNVLAGTGDLVDHWIVMFCPGWHDKCQGLLPSYELLGVQWENKLNKALMSSSARFVKVDCATEKALCVSLGIDDYPSVVHYRGGQRVASWHGGAPGLVGFVKQELEGRKRRASPIRKVGGVKTSSAAVCGSKMVTFPDEGRSWPFLRPLAFALLLAVVARSLWMLSRTAMSSSTRSDKGRARSD